MISTIIFSKRIIILYLFIYSSINYSIMWILNNISINYIRQFYYKINNKIKIIIFILILSLAGVPPLTGFLIKWITINIIIQFKIYFLLIIIIIISLITTFFYIQICFSRLFKINEQINFLWHKKIQFNFKFSILIQLIISILGLLFFIIFKNRF